MDMKEGKRKQPPAKEPQKKKIKKSSTLKNLKSI